jgi:hypothetical protein
MRVSEFSKTNLKEEYKEGIAFPLQKAVQLQGAVYYMEKMIHIIASIESFDEN